MDEGIERFIGRQVVLDTDGPILFLGTLKEVVPGGYWLEELDLHDCREGHASKEAYLIQAKLDGINPNRARSLVMASVVISVSALDDIVVD